VELLNDARSLKSQGKYRESLEKFNLAIEIESNDCKVFLERGEVRANLQDYRGAIADYNQFFKIGEYFLKQSNMKHKGYTDNDVQVLVFSMNIAKAYFNRGIAKNKLGDSIEACKDIRKSCELGNEEACEMAKKVCNQR
jgi:tetratricopeptide (TPR) repeat protein